MTPADKAKIHDIMMDLVEMATYMPHCSIEKRVESASLIASLILVKPQADKDVLLFAFITQMAALMGAYADLRGENLTEAVAHWRLTVMNTLMNQETDADPVL